MLQVSYHIGMLRLLSATAVGKINRTEAQGLQVVVRICSSDCIPINIQRCTLVRCFFMHMNPQTVPSNYIWLLENRLQVTLTVRCACPQSLEALLDIASYKTMPMSYRAELLQVFFHLAIEAEIKVPGLTKMKKVQNLLKEFTKNLTDMVSDKVSVGGAKTVANEQVRWC